MPEPPAVTDRGVDVEHRLLRDDHVRAQRDATEPDPPGFGAVAQRRGVLADHGARSDGEQVRACGDARGQHDRALADACTEGAQVHQVQRRAREHRHRVGPDQRLHQPEPQVGGPPRGELARLETPDEQPLGDDGQQRESDEGPRTPGEGTQVGVDDAGRGRHPQVPGLQHLRAHDQRGEEQEQLHGAARRVGERADPGHGRCRNGAPAARARRRPGGPAAARRAPSPSGARTPRGSTPVPGRGAGGPSRRTGPATGSSRPGRRTGARRWRPSRARARLRAARPGPSRSVRPARRARARVRTPAAPRAPGGSCGPPCRWSSAGSRRGAPGRPGPCTTATGRAAPSRSSPGPRPPCRSARCSSRPARRCPAPVRRCRRRRRAIPGTCSSTDSISVSSIRYPRILTWRSIRPWYSISPSSLIRPRSPVR